MDEAFRKIIRPFDARGPRGTFARGKNVYRHGSNSPKPKGQPTAFPVGFNLQEAARKRFSGSNSPKKNASGSRRPFGSV